MKSFINDGTISVYTRSDDDVQSTGGEKVIYIYNIDMTVNYNI